MSGMTTTVGVGRGAGRGEGRDGLRGGQGSGAGSASAGRLAGALASQWTDEELLARMLADEAGAWREFQRRFDRLVYRCIQRVTARFAGVLGTEDVREIHAQLMLSLAVRDRHKLRAFDATRGAKLSSWVGMLATNAAWDHLRSVARQPQTTTIDRAELVSSAAADPFEAMLERERWARVHDALSELSDKDRTFVQLYYVEGLSPEEVAGEMDISIKTVYSKKHKIRCRLERMLGHVAAEAAAA
jgi:RNA polymerase sigma-70 factor (ECF subfamily)